MDDKEAYVNALCLELEQRHQSLPVSGVDTVYFGGGTPSLLSKTHLKKIIDTVHQYFSISANAEITLEANPDDLSKTYLNALLELGFNRLSIGIQSFNNEDLRLIGRRHLGQDAIRAVNHAQESGFKNISGDLIFGLPHQTLAQWKKNLDQLFTLNVQHISCYNLSYESGTAFYNLRQKGELKELDDELNLEMFKLLISKSAQHGFIHYETSNFSKKGFHSKHNSNYWSGNPYLGVGAGAHSYDGKKRRWNVSDNQQYISGIETNTPQFEEENIDITTAYNEYIMTGLRTMWGCNLKQLKEKFGEEKFHYCMQAAQPYIDNKQLLFEDGIMTLSPEAIFISDQIMTDLMCV